MAQNSTAVATSGATPGAIDVSTVKNVDLLHAKAVGLIGVLFLTVTGAAPISAMLFNVPIAVGFGNGIGAPASFLFATIVLTIQCIHGFHRHTTNTAIAKSPVRAREVICFI